MKLDFLGLDNMRLVGLLCVLIVEYLGIREARSMSCSGSCSSMSLSET